MELLDYQIFDLPVRSWLWSFGVTIAVVIVLQLVQRFSFGRLGKLAKRTKTVWDDVIVGALGKTKLLFLIAVGVRVASAIWAPTGPVHDAVHAGFILVLLWQTGVWLTAGVRLGLEAFRTERKDEDPGAVTTVAAMGFVLQLLVWSIVALLALDNLGIEITTLVAGLGVGGIAVALAVQNILGDLFASLSIVLDKPFVIGDFIDVGGFVGTVENVGLKTTRVRSLSGEQLIFANNDLLQSRLRNYGRMFERRIVFSVGVTYQTPKDKLEEIPKIIRRLVEGQDRTRFDRSHFKEFGDSALVFETAYYVLVPAYAVYMEIQQAINLQLFQIFQEEGIEFAYPTQTVHVVSDAEATVPSS